MKEEVVQAQQENEDEPTQPRPELFLPLSDQVATLSSNHQKGTNLGDGDDGDLNVVEEIDSLCMNCQEDVCRYDSKPTTPTTMYSTNIYLFIGCDPFVTHQDTLLS